MWPFKKEEPVVEEKVEDNSFINSVWFTANGSNIREHVMIGTTLDSGLVVSNIEYDYVSYIPYGVYLSQCWLKFYNKDNTRKAFLTGPTIHSIERTYPPADDNE